jgi:thioesterase domain-containing protein
LLAVQMVERIQKACGKKLPLSALIAGATIERIATVLNTQDFSSGEHIDERIVPVQRSGTRQPLFLMHGDLTSGGVYSVHVARHLGPDQPLYILNPYPAHGQHQLPSFSAMAEENLCKVLEVDPDGPYYLAGMCNGAVVAYEMASRLRQMGKEVDMLVMIDPSRVDRVFRTVVKRFSGFFAAGPLPQELLALAPSLQDMDVSMAEETKAYLRALGEYEPQPLDRKVTLLWNSEKNLPPNGDATRGWGRLASAEHIGTIPGNHFTCISKHVNDLSAAIAQAIERAAARSNRN